MRTAGSQTGAICGFPEKVPGILLLPFPSAGNGWKWFLLGSFLRLAWSGEKILCPQSRAEDSSRSAVGIFCLPGLMD